MSSDIFDMSEHSLQQYKTSLNLNTNVAKTDFLVNIIINIIYKIF